MGTEGGAEAVELFWRSFEEREGEGALSPEFPPGADLPPSELTRRDFVKLLAASAALATTACGIPDQRILPYVRVPAEVTPGVPLYFATSTLQDGFATGLLVKSNEGRPTKVEGNPDHPASLGAAGPREQALILGLYDPARARNLTRLEARAHWDALARELATVRAPGTGLRFLLEPTSSPLLGALLGRLRAAYPAARFTFHSPLEAGASLEGARLAFGRPLLPQYDFSAALRILTVDADLLGGMPFQLRYQRQWAGARKPGPAGGARPISRMYAMESTLTVTGAAAEHRLRLRPERIGDALAAVASQLAASGRVALTAATRAALVPWAASPHSAWARTVAEDLAAHAGAGLVVVGPSQPPHVHALAHALNQALGNQGRTTWFTASPLLDPGPAGQSLEALAAEMRTGRVETLVILGGNPAYTAPVDLDFADALRRVPRSIYHGLYRDETARVTTWFVPAAHTLESWGDGRAYDGTASLVQPLIAPLWGGRTEAEVLALLLGQPNAGAHALLRESWRSGLASDAAWDAALQKGVLDASAFPREAVGAAAAWTPPVHAVPPATGLSLEFRRDYSLQDGRYAANGWLQELPDPITKLTWGNAALVSPATARRLGLSSGDVVTLRLRGRTLDVPAMVLPGEADDTVTLPLGYGRTAGAGAGSGLGADAYRLRTAAAPFADVSLELHVAGRQENLASTQAHWSMHGRPLVLSTTIERYRDNPDFASAQRGPVVTLYDPYQYRTGHQWAMVIDTSICTGCSACVVACQAENNVPLVGREGVEHSREMQWLRIDRYFSGDPADPSLAMQPMLCQHCEQAPCEYVCPVQATVHSPEGLNEMIYNRCVGTRFCSNNCPYKVRRFNWFNYNKHLSETEKMGKNPDVTVRARGVMEKCSFCIQRIQMAEIAAGTAGQPLAAGAVRTACQQACPTQAIVFGTYTEPTPELAAAFQERRRYAVLHDEGTRPRVTYLARITNPNPALGPGAAPVAAGLPGEPAAATSPATAAAPAPTASPATAAAPGGAR